MPVTFGSKLPRSDAGQINREPLNRAIKELSDIVWKEGGFRFHHFSTNLALRFEYHCCQDQAHERELDGSRIRDVPKMTRFPCQSSLIMQPRLDDRVLTLELYHLYHQPYSDRQLSSEVIDFIDARKATSTPAEIFRDLLASDVPGASSATQHQVYYRWKQSNMTTWRRHSDPVQSAELLIDEQAALYDGRVYASGSVKGIAFYIRHPVKVLASTSRELAMDSTFGTNNAGMSLFSVLAEVDGAGIPLGYCFTKSTDSGSEAGAQTVLLVQFLQPFRHAGFMPTFFWGG